MTTCIDPILLGSPLLDTVGSQFLLGQAGWVPTWLTPLWLIGVGLTLGAAACLVVYALLAILSFIPGLGTIADDPRRGVIVSLLVGVAFAVALCFGLIDPSQEHSELLYLPVICIGLILGFGLVYGMWHRTRAEWKQFVAEGVIPYLLGVAGCFVVIALVATPLIGDPMRFVRSIPQVNLFSDGVVSVPISIPGTPPEVDQDEAPFIAANVDYETANAANVTIESNRTILIADSDDPASFTRRPVRVNAGEKLEYRFADREVPPLPRDPKSLFIQNREYDAAEIFVTITYVPTIPEVSSLVTIAISFFLTLTGLMVFRQAAPRVWALALSTAKNEMAQPLYLLLLAIGVFLILLFGIYPFNTLGDDIRVLKDSGVTMIMVLGMLQAIWSAGTSVSDEIDGRTALTVLSKPVSRRSFILGKYAGIMLAVFVLFVIMSAVLFIVLSYKPIFEARETTRDVTTWQQGHAEIMTTMPLLALYFMEMMAIGAIAVALATRLPLLANFITCFVIYVIGNLTSPLVASTEGNNELVGFVGKLIAVIVPNLNVFNVQSAVDVGNPIPIIYLSAAFNYLVCFAIAAWMLAMLLFEDRDLA
jgi:ABC-type transport system involved in multi-copper enzyme maturation permease subunit